jgi:Transposase domain (DUF772)
MGRPGLPPGIYFRLLLIGYFEGIDSERGIAWRAAQRFPRILELLIDGALTLTTVTLLAPQLTEDITALRSTPRVTGANGKSSSRSPRCDRCRS